MDPVWQSRSDWEIYKGFAKTFSEVCVGHLGVEKEVVLTLARLVVQLVFVVAKAACVAPRRTAAAMAAAAMRLARGRPVAVGEADPPGASVAAKAGGRRPLVPKARANGAVATHQHPDTFTHQLIRTPNTHTETGKWILEFCFGPHPWPGNKGKVSDQHRW